MRHPGYVEKNKNLQKKRNFKTRYSFKKSEMDTHVIAKMDELLVRIDIITQGYAFVIKDSGLIGPNDLPGYVHENKDVDICHALPNSEIECEEKTVLIEALKKSMGNKSQAARILGISRGTVWNRMRKYEINPQKIIFS